MIQNFLKLCCGLAPLMGGKIRFPSNVNRIHVGGERGAAGKPQFVWCSGVQCLDGLGAIVSVKGEFGTNRWQVIKLDNRIFGKMFRQILRRSLSSGRVASQC